MSAGPIWTLEARDSVFLEVMTEEFSLSDAQIRRLLVSSHEQVIAALSRKGVGYAELKWALMPRSDRAERAYFFDRRLIDSDSYGRAVVRRLLPLLHRDATCSFLVGDLIPEDKEWALGVLSGEEHLRPRESLSDSRQLYCIYINNLTSRMAHQLHEGLTSYDAYAGYADTTFSSDMKNWLSVTLVNRYLKVGPTFLTMGEDDDDRHEDVNVPGWPLEAFGYRYRSVAWTDFNLFLSYKIERAVYKGFEGDTRFALASISGVVQDLSMLEVRVDEAKAKYLQAEHGGSLRRAGLGGADPTQLQEAIRSKVGSNYIYYLRFKEEGNASLFNIMIEFTPADQPRPVRMTAALAYEPERRQLRIVTLF